MLNSEHPTIDGLAFTPQTAQDRFNLIQHSLSERQCKKCPGLEHCDGETLRVDIASSNFYKRVIVGPVTCPLKQQQIRDLQQNQRLHQSLLPDLYQHISLPPVWTDVAKTIETCINKLHDYAAKYPRLYNIATTACSPHTAELFTGGGKSLVLNLDPGPLNLLCILGTAFVHCQKHVRYLFLPTLPYVYSDWPRLLLHFGEHIDWLLLDCWERFPGTLDQLKSLLDLLYYRTSIGKNNLVAWRTPRGQYNVLRCSEEQWLCQQHRHQIQWITTVVKEVT